MDKKIKVVIADDEALARDIVEDYLQAFPEIEIVERCKNGFETIKAINQTKTDILFLDIQMPKLTGMEVLELLDEKPVIIFTTAYDEYAIKAFELNAVDYLLKPFSEARFAEACQKAITKVNAQEKTDQNIHEKLTASEHDEDHKLTRVVVKKGAAIHVIPLDHLMFIEAQDDYVMLYSKEGKFLKQRTMKYFETSLPADKFVRVHRSYIANIEQIDKIELFAKDSYVAKMKNGESLKISASGYKNLRSSFNF